MQKQKKREDIILDIGYEHTKIGVTSDKTPRKVLKSSHIFKQIQLRSWQLKLEQFLYKIFFTQLNYSPTQKTVILIQNLNFKRQYLEVIAKLLFRKFDVAKIQFCLASVTPLYCTAKYSGIVISSGFSWTEFMGIYQSYPLMRQFKALNIGSSIITKNLKQKILLNNPDIREQQIKQQLLIDIKLNYSNMIPRKQTISVAFQRNKIKFSESWISFEDYFGQYQEQQPNIAYAFLEFLNSVDVSCLKSICSNVVFSGGIWNVKGFKSQFKKRVVKLLELSTFSKLKDLKIKQFMRFAELPFNPSELAWIGSGIASSLANIDYFCIKKQKYLVEGFKQKIMQNYFLGEFSDSRQRN